MTLSERYTQLQHAMAPYPARLIAVTKTATVDQMQAAYALGIQDFGESRVQDALLKKSQLPTAVVQNVRWHLIGHLQRNKVEKTVGQFHLIHSVDSLPLAAKLSDANQTAGHVQAILLQVNLSGEPQKFGFSENEIMAVYPELLNLSGITIQGLMTMAPLGAEDTTVQKVFYHLKSLKTLLEERYKTPLKELSMGMSQDYMHALECGATMIRVGSFLFP